MTGGRAQPQCDQARTSPARAPTNLKVRAAGDPGGESIGEESAALSESTLATLGLCYIPPPGCYTMITPWLYKTLEVLYSNVILHVLSR